MQDIVTLLSVIVVLVTFGFGYIERRSNERRQRTLEFLMKVIEGEGPIHEAHIQFASWVKSNRTFLDDDVSIEDDNVIIKLLDYYDLVADTAIRKVIDKEMIILHLGGRMRTTYTTLSNYIHSRRKRLGRSGLYLSLEKFINNHIQQKDV